MDQPPAVAFTAFTDVWLNATETEIGAALCAIGAGRTLPFLIHLHVHHPQIPLINFIAATIYEYNYPYHAKGTYKKYTFTRQMIQ